MRERVSPSFRACVIVITRLPFLSFLLRSRRFFIISSSKHLKEKEKRKSKKKKKKKRKQKKKEKERKEPSREQTKYHIQTSLG